MRHYLFGLAILAMTVSAYAQETVLVRDLESWNAVQLEKDFGKLALQTELQTRWSDNATSLNQYFGEVGLEYKLFKPIKVAVAYRFGKENEKEGFVNANRFHFDLNYSKKLGDFRWDSRVRYQTKSEADEIDPINKIRFRTGFEYNISNWKLDPKLSVEYFRLTNSALDPHDKMRYTLSTKYKINKHNAIGAFYRIEQELKETYPANYYIIGLNYRIKF